MFFQYIAGAGFLFILGVTASSVISSGEGFGTYYYDIDQVDACGTTFKSQNKGGVTCSSDTLLSLDEIDSNYVVAMNNSQLRADPPMYCGRKVVVTINGQKSDLPLFIGDGCERCAGGTSGDTWNAASAPGLDFSYSVLDKLSEGNACSDGHIAISWEILDKLVYNFDGSSSGAVFGTATPIMPASRVSSAQATTTPSKTYSNNAWQ